MITGTQAHTLIMDDIHKKEHEAVTALEAKLNRSEKRLLQKAGKRPRKDQTGNLIRYMELFTDEEADMLVRIINKYRKNKIHLGMLPFMEREYVLKLVETFKETRVWTSKFYLKPKDPKVEHLKKQLREEGHQAAKAATQFQQFASRIHRMQKKG